MLNKKIIKLSSILLSFILFSCSPHFEMGKTSLKIPLPGSKSVSRKISVDDETYYKITCSRSDINFSQSLFGYSGDEIRFDELIPGTYTISGQAFQDETMKFIIYEGSKTVTLKGGKEETVTLFLDGSYNITEDDIKNYPGYDSWFEYEPSVPKNSYVLDDGSQKKDGNMYLFPLSFYKDGVMPDSSVPLKTTEDFGQNVSLIHHSNSSNYIDKACFTYHNTVFYVMDYYNAPVICNSDNPEDLLFDRIDLSSADLMEFKFWRFKNEAKTEKDEYRGYGYQAKHIKMPDGSYVDITVAEYYYSKCGFRVWIKESTAPVSQSFLKIYDGLDSDFNDMIQIDLDNESIKSYFETATSINIQQKMNGDYGNVFSMSINDPSLHFKDLDDPIVLPYVDKGKEYTYRLHIRDNTGILYTTAAQTIKAQGGFGEIKFKNFTARYNSSKQQVELSTNSLFNYTLPEDTFQVYQSVNYRTDDYDWMYVELDGNNYFTVKDLINSNNNPESVLGKKAIPSSYSINISKGNGDLYASYEMINYQPTNLPTFNLPTTLPKDPEFLRLNASGNVEFFFTNYQTYFDNNYEVVVCRKKGTGDWESVLSFDTENCDSSFTITDPYVDENTEYTYYLSFWKNGQNNNTTPYSITPTKGQEIRLTSTPTLTFDSDTHIISMDPTTNTNVSLGENEIQNIDLYYKSNSQENLTGCFNFPFESIDLGKYLKTEIPWNNTLSSFIGDNASFTLIMVNIYKRINDMEVSYTARIPVSGFPDITFPAELPPDPEFVRLNGSGNVEIYFDNFNNVFTKGAEIHIYRKSNGSNYEQVINMRTNTSSTPLTVIDPYVNANTEYNYKIDLFIDGIKESAESPIITPTAGFGEITIKDQPSEYGYTDECIVFNTPFEINDTEALDNFSNRIEFRIRLVNSYQCFSLTYNSEGENSIRSYMTNNTWTQEYGGMEAYIESFLFYSSNQDRSGGVELHYIRTFNMNFETKFQLPSF